MNANNSMLSNLHLKLSTSGLRFFYYPFYFVGMALYYMFTGLFASIKWIALAPFKLIMNLPEIILTVGRGLMFLVSAIMIIWFSPALLLKKLELDFLANVLGVILLILGLTFFEHALKPIFLSYWSDFQATELWMTFEDLF